MASKALSPAYTEDQGCPAVEFQIAALRPDLISRADAKWIVGEMRPSPLCNSPPPNAPWGNRSIDTLLVTHIGQGCSCMSACFIQSGNSTSHPLHLYPSPNPLSPPPDSNPRVVQTVATDINLVIDMMISGVAALQWFDVVLLSDQRCSWDGVRPDVAAALRASASKYNVWCCVIQLPLPTINPFATLPPPPSLHLPPLQVTIHASGNGSLARSCEDLTIASISIMLLVTNNLNLAAEVLLQAYQNSWLGPR